ncbi:MAG: hypothetical protein II943_05505 [Victivallales bacterium]|nr:hypothetical protein [Victivallales bacterium]
MTTEVNKHPCPCCGRLVDGAAGDYTICPHCAWEDDPVQAKDPAFPGGANPLSLEEARRVWAADHPRLLVKRRRFGRGRS